MDFTKKTFNSNEKVIAVKAIYDRIWIRELSDKMMQVYFNKALVEFILINFAREIKGG